MNKLVILLSIILWSCQIKPEKENISEVLDIAFPAVSQAESITRFEEEHFFIPTETTEESLLGEVNRLEVDQEQIYISDGKKIVCFEVDEEINKARILYTINKTGKGPGEYYRVNDISVQDSFLYVHDREVLCYNKFTGKFVKKISLDFAAMDMVAWGDYLVFYSGFFQNYPENSYELFVVNVKTDEVSRYFKHRKNNFGGTQGKVFSKIGDKLCYCSPYRNMVYQFDSNATPVPLARLNYNDGEIIDLEHLEMTMREVMESNYCYHFCNLLEINNYLRLRFYFKGIPWFLWYNQSSKETTVTNVSFYANWDVFQNYLISPVESWRIAMFNPEEYKNDTSILKAFSKVRKVNEDDNPCLMFIRLKQ